MNFILLTLTALGIIGGIGFWSIIKHFNYELNFKESLLFLISILVITVTGLIDFNLLQIDSNYTIIIGFGITIYFLVLLALYYIIRSIKLKKYIPIKVILAYTLTSISYLAVMIIIESTFRENVRYIEGWGMVAFIYMFYIIYGAYSISLIFINLVLLLIALFIFLSKKHDIISKNTKYTFSKSSFFGTLFTILGSLIIIGFYNESNCKKLLERQKEIVMNYLNEEYPYSKFEITDTIYSSENSDSTFGYGTPVIRNIITNQTTGKEFTIDIKVQDLTIYKNSFKLLERYKPPQTSY